MSASGMGDNGMHDSGMGDGPMSEAHLAAIERACTRLVLDAADCNDRRDFEGLAALFTENATFTRPGPGEPLTSREAIVESYRSRPADRITRHQCSNIRIVVEGPDRARGHTYVVVYGASASALPDRHFGVPGDPRVLLGEFDDEFVRTQDGWRISARRAYFVLYQE